MSRIFPIEMVRVGNPGNADDTADGDANTAGIQRYGGVPYFFRIGKTEVTMEQYAAFLNAVAKTDTYGLYHPGMETDPDVAGIRRSGVSGNYSYLLIGNGKRPITYVNWLDAARFCNWLHNGRPRGLQDLSTTETGAYSLFGNTSGTGFGRSASAKYWIPSEDEWYKAAFHDPRSPLEAGPPGGGNYWTYPTQSPFGAPAAEPPPGGSNSANYNFAAGGMTPVGAYRDSSSYYGTFDQGGNVWEWNESVLGGGNRGARGASWDHPLEFLRSSARGGLAATNHSDTFGFRVAGR